MADVHSKKVRSYNMSRIRGHNTVPEMLVRRYLFSKGLRYRIHEKTLPGKPDIVFKSRRIAIFIHGCFWHGHEGCRYFVVPKTKTAWWIGKINSNKMRDALNTAKLIEHGWKVIEIFECELRKDKRDRTLNEIYTQIH
jgi:DNA mismatch endonuclease, patch repair protein